MSTEEDRTVLVQAIPWRYVSNPGIKEAIVEALLPVVDAIAQRRAAQATEPFRELFAGGPDTACRTTYRESALQPECSAASVECVEVPMDDLREAFGRADTLGPLP